MDTPLEITPYVFVYGTLKYGHGNWRWALSEEEYVGPDTTEDRYVLGNVGFPFAFPEEVVKDYISEDMLKRVSGDVFRLTQPETLVRLDGLEGEGSLYHRRLITTVNGYTTWMYHNMYPSDMHRCYECATTEEGEWIWLG